jgi:hypothetical protein
MAAPAPAKKRKALDGQELVKFVYNIDQTCKISTKIPILVLNVWSEPELEPEPTLKVGSNST